MPGRLFLSPLPSVGGTLRRPQPGRWYAAPDFLGQYSTDILVQGTVGHQQIVRGVPSVFAQPIYFSHALRDRRHPAHASAVGQWRGLLACFALQRWLRLALEVKPFAVGELPAPGGGRPDEVLLTVLHAQLPAPDADWHDWWLLRCEGKLLGATSPWSMVYPSAQSQAPVSIPWQRNGVLIDPIDHYDERRQARASTELSLLATWVDRVFAGQPQRWGAPSGGSWDAGLTLAADGLGAWRGDLAPYRRAGDRTLELESGGLRSVAAPYDAFLQPIDAQNVLPESTLLLRAPDGAQYIVLKRQGLDTKQRVHGSTLVEELDLRGMASESPLAWKTRTGREMALPYVFAEDVFLTSKLTEIPLAEHAISLAGGRFALPLRSGVFRFFSYGDLKDGKLKLELRETESSYTVRLIFPLADGSPFFVERTYDKSADVLRFNAQDAPALALWPDFASPDWKHSLALFVALETNPLVVAPLSVAGVPLEISPADRDHRDWVAWRSDQPLLGFVLYSGKEADQGEAGLVLRAEAKAPPNGDQNTKWQVAVDFGTSNTQLMVTSTDDEKPKPLEIRGRTVLLSRPYAPLEAEANDAFFPTEGSIQPPFPSVVLNNQGWSATPLPGAMQGDLFSPRFFLKPGTGLQGIVRDLKWPRGGAGRGDLPIRGYLNLLAQAINAEAVAAGVRNVVIHWSFPLALPDPPKQTMTNFWQTVPQTYSSPRSNVSIAPEGGRSESEALSRYFANLPGNLPIRSEALSIAVDVGGGSTDVGFWSSGRFLDQISFKLAGNDLLVPLAKNDPRFLESLFEICTGTHPGSDLDAAMIHQAEISLNILLLNSGETVPLALHGRLAAGEPPWSIARTVVYLFFTGVVFYLGLHSRRLLARIQRQEFAVLFGGKAAGLLPWLTNDPATLERVLGGMFLAGLGYDDASRERLPVTFYGPGIRRVSNNALPLKSEVAYGLLLPALPGEQPRAPTTTIIGELGWRASAQAPEALPWDTEVNLATLASLHAPDNLETGFAPYFAATLASRHAAELGLDVAGLQSLRLAVSDVEDTVRTLAASQGVLQPIFAGELKRLIERYLDGVKEA